MSDPYNDPSANTAQFKAFVAEPEPASGSSRTGLVVAGIAVAAVVVAVIAWALL